MILSKTKKHSASVNEWAVSHHKMMVCSPFADIMERLILGYFTKTRLKIQGNICYVWRLLQK